jgi:FkbM family methyltransferase
LEIPRVFHRVWLGESQIPEEFERYWAEWAELHPGWEMKTWYERDLDWLKNRREFDAPGPFSGKANIARYEILHREGGVYVDTDFQPLSNLEPLLEGARFIAGEERPGLLNNAFIGATPGHPIMQYVIEELPSSFWGNEGEISPHRSGPHFLTRCVRRAAEPDDDSVRIASREQLYPYSFEQTDLRRVSTDRSVAVHHWAKSWAPSAEARPSRWQKQGRVAARQGLRRVKRVSTRLQAVWRDLEPKSPRPIRPLHATFVGDNQMLVRLDDRFPLYCFADDLGVTPSLVIHGAYEPHFIRFLERTLRRGDVAVDVGANIGVFAIPMAYAVGAYGRVYCFEPQPVTFSLLQRSFYANEMRGLSAEVRLRNVAVGSEPGVASLASPRHHRGRSSLAESALLDTGERPTDRFDVPVVRLDDELAGNPEIRIVKIDVEGRELDVLRSAQRLLDEGRVHYVDIELVDVHAGAEWHELVAYLRSLDQTTDVRFCAIRDDGSLTEISLDRALHSDRMQHLVLDFTGCATAHA